MPSSPPAAPPVLPNLARSRRPRDRPEPASLLAAFLPDVLAHLATVAGRIDPAGVIREVAGAGLDRLGWQEGDLLGAHLLVPFPGARDALRTTQGGSATTLLLRGEHPARGPWAVELVLRPMQDGGAGAWFIARDVTAGPPRERPGLALRETALRHVGAEVHDDLGQRLVGLACLGRALAARLQRDDPAGAADATLVAELAQETHAQCRALAHGLEPQLPGGAELPAALAQLLAQARRIHRLETHCDLIGPAVEYPMERAVQLYRIVQESLANAVRHGRARTFTLTLDRRFARHRLTLVDDGDGFDVGRLPARPEGAGRTLMAQRAAALGGELQLTSAPGAGTRVECVFPGLAEG